MKAIAAREEGTRSRRERGGESAERDRERRRDPECGEGGRGEKRRAGRDRKGRCDARSKRPRGQREVEKAGDGRCEVKTATRGRTQKQPAGSSRHEDPAGSEDAAPSGALLRARSNKAGRGSRCVIATPSDIRLLCGRGRKAGRRASRMIDVERSRQRGEWADRPTQVSGPSSLAPALR